MFDLATLSLSIPLFFSILLINGEQDIVPEFVGHT
jgi:hypothetical protein